MTVCAIDPELSREEIPQIDDDDPCILAGGELEDDQCSDEW